MSSTAPSVPEPTVEPDPQPTLTVPTEPPSETTTEPPTDPPTEPPSEPPTEPPTIPPPVTSDDSTIEDPPPPAPPTSKSSSTDEPAETTVPSTTSETDPSITSTATSDTSNSGSSETIITTSVVTSKKDGTLTTVVLTSTAAAPTETVSVSGTSTSGAGSALQTSGSGSDDSGGLSPGGTIAVAVVVPVVAVTIIIVALIIWWRRREANKRSEQQRKSEIEDYGYNPNNDPTLPTVGGSSYDGGSEMREDNSGYRGWGTTNSRKLSTNLSSGPGVGNTVSENGSNRGYHHAGSPSDGTAQFSDGIGRVSGDSETIGALGMGPATSHNRANRDIARGPSNASSANSGGHRSEGSEDGTLIEGPGGPGYYEENPYYNQASPQQGPYGDGSYAGGHPVIRDVTARRNTRIESPSVVPQQGNTGISQNF